MDGAVQVVWWIGLIGALGLTLAILKIVALLIGALRDINRLADLTGEAAEGVADNVATQAQLEHLEAPASALVEAVGRVAEAVRALDRGLAAPPKAGGQESR